MLGKRQCCNDKATSTILPQVFYKCSKLNILFSGNHVLPSKLNIPRFYTIVETLNKSLWYDSFLNSNTDTLFSKSWSNKGIKKITHIINEQGQFLSHNQLKDAYNINTPFLTTIQIKYTKNMERDITKIWQEIFKYIIRRWRHNPFSKQRKGTRQNNMCRLLLAPNWNQKT